MIILYSGIIGSGKSYKMVSDLFEARHKYFVIHNIDGLQEGFLEAGFDFVKRMEDEGIDAKVFFSKEYQEALCKSVEEKYQRNVLVIIDEAGEWFGSQVKSQRLWLAYHRHLGQEIWLVAHKATDLASIYRSFIEVEWRGKSGSMLYLPGRFFYQRISGGQRAGWKFEKINKEVFKVYKSSARQEIKAKKSFLVPAAIIFIIVVLFAFIKLPGYLFGGSKGKLKDIKKDVRIVDSMPARANNDLKAIVANNKIEDEYSYQGNFNGQLVFQNLKTGRQSGIKGLHGRFIIIDYKGSEYCELYDIVEKRQFVVLNTVYNGSSSDKTTAERSGGGGFITSGMGDRK